MMKMVFYRCQAIDISCPIQTVAIIAIWPHLMYMETQVQLKTIALTLFLNLFFHFLPEVALCQDFSLVDSDEILNAESNSS